MKILKHEIKNYRNIENIYFEPDENINVLYGENGQGKTNIIESIWLFTGCNSFRTRKTASLLKKALKNLKSLWIFMLFQENKTQK